MKITPLILASLAAAGAALALTWMVWVGAEPAAQVVPDGVPALGRSAAGVADVSGMAGSAPEGGSWAATAGAAAVALAASGSARPDAALAARVQAVRTEITKVLVSDQFARHQMSIRDVSCEAQRCSIDFQLPPFVEASQRRDPSVAAEMMAALQAEFSKQGAQVGLTHVEHPQEGMVFGFAVQAAPEKGRYMTETDIAKLRAETLQDYLKSQKP